MSKAIRTNEKLWQSIKRKWHRGSKGGKPGQWNARKAQLAVQEYKRRGGKYKGRKSTSNRLRIWTDEKWGYVDGKKGNRYLPKKVREKLTPREKITTNRRKRAATKRGQQYAKYSPKVLKKFQTYRKSRTRRKSKRSKRSKQRKRSKRKKSR